MKMGSDWPLMGDWALIEFRGDSYIEARLSKPIRESTIVRDIDFRLRKARARLTFSKASVALAVQMKGLGLSL
jgi:hypothetical protein